MTGIDTAVDAATAAVSDAIAAAYRAGRRDARCTSCASDVHPVVFATAEYYGVPHDAMIGRDRTFPVAHARQVAMWILRNRFDLSYPRIGELVGRDHTSVIHGVDKIDRQMDPDTQADIRTIMKMAG